MTIDLKKHSSTKGIEWKKVYGSMLGRQEDRHRSKRPQDRESRADEMQTTWRLPQLQKRMTNEKENQVRWRLPTTQKIVHPDITRCSTEYTTRLHLFQSNSIPESSSADRCDSARTPSSCLDTNIDATHNISSPCCYPPGHGSVKNHLWLFGFVLLNRKPKI